MRLAAQESAGANGPKYHTPPANSHPLMRQQAEFSLPSLLVTENGEAVRTPDQWSEQRNRLVQQWTKILGKLEPTADDLKWFGDISAAIVQQREMCDGYERVTLKLPQETDFLQSYLLLVPQNQGPGPFPAVVAWTSTGPDFTAPEQWWGKWLAQRGYVVLTGWSFIRNYRQNSDFRHHAGELVFERFGRWAPLSKMVYDARREAEYLQSLPEVDPQRIGFMGFSLSAKAALYVAALAKDFSAVVSIDPHLALYGATNYGEPWYLDWNRKFADIHTDGYPDPEMRSTIWSLLDADPQRPGFEHNHHEILALAAPKPLLVIACSSDHQSAEHSDDRQSSAYIERAREVYELLGVGDRLKYVATTRGHRPTGPVIDAAWQQFFERWLKDRRALMD